MVHGTSRQLHGVKQWISSQLSCLGRQPMVHSLLQHLQSAEPQLFQPLPVYHQVQMPGHGSHSMGLPAGPLAGQALGDAQHQASASSSKHERWDQQFRSPHEGDSNAGQPDGRRVQVNEALATSSNAGCSFNSSRQAQQEPLELATIRALLGQIATNTSTRD
eukprot:GHUV01044486.1.p1 GENE.GHUV01044486.1~~GHUV01044486.1.p1  ORF type:complete len:162 (+),score=32.62 GHUV01044486.1:3-488(+)